MTIENQIASIIDERINDNSTLKNMDETIKKIFDSINQEKYIGYYSIDELIDPKDPIIPVSRWWIETHSKADNFPKLIKLGNRCVISKKDFHKWMEINNSKGFDYIEENGWSNILKSDAV